MLHITIESREFYNSITNEIFTIKPQTIVLEHSLVSVSKWESIWKKPFMSNEHKTNVELISYIKCMTITQNVDDIIYQAITDKQLLTIQKYIDDPMSATWFNDLNKLKGSKKTSKPNPFNKQVITSEIIYYWMVAARIPFNPCEKWHLNRLLTLIRVCNEKNNPQKQSKQDVYKTNAALNKARREKLHSRG